MPAIRSAKNAELICSRIVEGYTLRQIAREIDCTAGAISIWCAEDADFAKQYAHAKELQADRMADEILEIADDATNDWMRREQDGLMVADHEHMQRSKLRVDARKWLMSKMLPKKYGDRLAVAGDPDAPLQHEDITERQKRAKEALDAAFGAIEASVPGKVD